MKFATRDNPPPRRVNTSGNRYEPEFVQRYDENGTGYLEQTGMKDVYEEIQSFAEEADIHRLIARYAAGDPDVIARMQQLTDGDMINQPKTITEYMNRMEELKAQFNGLPAKIREKFGNDFRQYAAQAGTDEWFSKLNKERAAQPDENSVKDTKVSEVKANES